MLRPAPALLLLGALVLAPAAQADFAVDVPATVGPLEPGKEQAAVRFHVTDDCQDLLARASPGSQAVPFSLIPKARSPYILSIGPDSGEIPLAPCLQGQPESSADLDWQVALKPDAPGLESLRADTEVRLIGSDVTTQPRSVEASFSASGKPLLLLQVQGRKLLTSHGDHVDVRLNVTNFSNVKATVAFEAVEAPRGKVHLPEPVVVNAPQSGLGNAQEVVVRYDVPSGAWDVVGLTLAVTPTAFLEPDAVGEPLEVHALVRNGNVVERAAPAPTLPLGLTGLALAALAVRRRA